MSTKRLPHLRLDFRSGAPVYLQVVRHVQREAANGRLRPGDQLPTVRGLALDLDVNFNTVARAYRLLHQGGVVSTQRGRGTYLVAQESSPAARRLPRQALQAWATEFVAAARRADFSDSQIAAMVTRRLDTPRAAARPGDKVG